VVRGDLTDIFYFTFEQDCFLSNNLFEWTHSFSFRMVF
jgi:hypothetical protein